MGRPDTGPDTGPDTAGHFKIVIHCGLALWSGIVVELHFTTGMDLVCYQGAPVNQCKCRCTNPDYSPREHTALSGL